MQIRQENIFLDIQEKEKFNIFKQMISESDIQEKIKDFAFERVKEREEMQSTSVGNGIGIAHAKLDNIDDIEVLLGISQGGIDYDAIDDKMVKLIFIVLYPKDKNREYLNTLAKISKICRKDALISDILKENNKDNLVEIFHNLKNR